ncbi:Metallo-beta-lactamase domain-containing protein 1 [Caenorhabditis elegans]|uniref:Metallo-beta-lactamase domain-containing protein 1 n=1 Tax=Caenorhabditis elegans TaxID=6239 RepID=Q20700_CAEEL|nr:Metallo-beta-lactamase domain-containing protein [Caenorhabditis elegans]CCD68829.2 Metallo-beta-lactamase domain-containing protein [Caenorhabditis elegans]
MLFHFLIAINFVLHFSSATDYIISKQDIKQLDEWDLKVLRDFVRGRGRPIVERIPLDLEDGPDFKEPDQDFELIDFSSPMISQGGMFAAPSNKKAEMFPIPLTPPQPITQIITPASKRKPKPPPKPPQLVEDKPSVEDYEQLASMIQMFIDRRSHKKNGDQALQNNAKSKKKSGEVLGSEKRRQKEHISMKTYNALPDQIITASKDGQDVTFDTNSNNSNKWKPMQRFTSEEKTVSKKQKPSKNNAPKSQEVYETRMKELSTELTKILKQLEGTKLEKQPEVHVLRNGSAEQTIDGQYTFIASITLVKDGDKSILVDTGLGTNINARTELIKSLEMHGLSPADVDIVVSTHGHPDHVGGVHDFPDALHYHGWYSHQRTKFNLTALFENDTMNLSENVMLVKCRGHTSDDIGVVVRGVKRRGDVLVSGDLFMREEDIDHPMMWQPLSADVIAQRDSRRRYGCIVDWIVPGHGSMFQVTTNVKKALKC